MKRCMLVAAVLAILGAVIPVFGAGLIIVEDPSWWPGPVPPRPVPPSWPHPIPPSRPYVFAPLEVRSVKVNTRITDQVAVTAVDQEFYNPNPARLEGTFVFPVPKGAHLDKFSMEIDGKKVEAELLGADKARRIYEDIVRKLRDPALLEYSDRDIFKVRIFPIEPNSKKRITLSYTELLKSDSGLVSYLLPLSAEKFSCQPVKNVSVKVELETRRSLKSIYSPSHTVEIKRDGPHRATAGYEATEVRPETDFALYFAPEKDEIGLNLLSYNAGSEDGYFLLLASPGVEVKENQVVMKDIVFVLDTSGSMAGKKLEQAKKALQFCVENLNDGDRFEILRFSTQVEPLFDKLVAANKQNRSRAEDFVKDLKAMGGTAIDDALRKALELGRGTEPQTGAAENPKSESRNPKQIQTDGNVQNEGNRGGHASDRPFVVIFLTDGQPTIGLTDENQIVANANKENDGHTRVFCFGIGTDVNTHLLDKITEATHAFSTYVLPEEDLEVKVSNFYSKIKEPVLSNPTLRFTGEIRATKLYPSPLPDLFKGEQLLLVGRYSGQGPAGVVIEGSVNGVTRKFAYDAKFAGDSTENEFIPRLWATRRVGYLLDEIRLHGENSELRDEVSDLARKYGIVTPYTAYLIVEDEARRGVPVPLQSMGGLQRDRVLRQEAQHSWDQFLSDRSGDSGVASALSGQALKSANAAAPAAAGAQEMMMRSYGMFAGRPGMPGVAGFTASGGVPAAISADSAPARLAQSSQQAQFVAGKSFFQNGNQWLDSALQKSPNAPRLRLQFGSPEYFEFVAKHAQARPWIALGQNVQFVLDNRIVEIYE